jgi:hypothetical protein
MPPASVFLALPRYRTPNMVLENAKRLKPCPQGRRAAREWREGRTISRSPRRPVPVIDPPKRLAHKRRPLAVGQAVSTRNASTPCLYVSIPTARSSRCPTCTVRSQRRRDSKERVPDVLIREELVQERASPADFHRLRRRQQRSFDTRFSNRQAPGSKSCLEGAGRDH